MHHGELQLVEWLRARLRSDPSRVPIGIGDDMAAVRLNGSLVTITSDMLLDGVHFDTLQHSYELIGRKAIACSLSDCAAMGCSPRAATVSIALNREMRMEQVQALYEGMARIGDEFDCPIVGGDTTSWSGGLAIDVAMIAEPMFVRGPIRRSTAQPGDTIYVSGPLGGSILGKHLTFIPRLELARRLAAVPELHAMMDISDGLGLDLYRLCNASGCDAELRSDWLEAVISDAAREMVMRDGVSPLEHALGDGEDFELLVVGDGELGRIAPELLAVGQVVPAGNGGACLYQIGPNASREPIKPTGYQHLT